MPPRRSASRPLAAGWWKVERGNAYVLVCPAGKLHPNMSIDAADVPDLYDCLERALTELAGRAVG